MSKSNNGDWTLCWWFNSETGCKNPNCTWRHEKFTDVHYQTQQQKIGNFHSRDSSEKSNTYPSICKVTSANHKYDLWSKLLRHKLQSEYCRLIKQTMISKSALSPYAEVFVPSDEKLASIEKLALGESSSFAGEVAHRLPNCNSGRVIYGKVYE